MNEHSSSTPSAVSGALLASGFPFQTAVARIVKSADGWRILAEEVPWRDIGGEDRFLDIVAVKHRFVVPIECKKTQKEFLTFLQPDDTDHDVNRARCIYLTQIQDSTKRMELFCGDWMLIPKSSESRFCVVATSSSGKDQRLLERDAQQLIRGTDAYARRFKADFKVEQIPESDRPFVPIIVTNAELFVAQYSSTDVSVETGQFQTPLPATVQPVPWVRFRKAFSASGKDVGDRTLFVVRASELATWLAKLEFAGTDKPDDAGKMHIP